MNEMERRVSKPKKQHHCSFCANHGKRSIRLNHHCEYCFCECEKCNLTRRVHDAMKQQQRIWRYIKPRLESEHSKQLGTKFRGQVCDKCRNHGRLIAKKKHKCTYSNCMCSSCSISSGRQKLMRYLQRVRRSIPSPELQEIETPSSGLGGVNKEEEMESSEGDADIDLSRISKDFPDEDSLNSPIRAPSTNITEKLGTRNSKDGKKHHQRHPDRLGSPPPLIPLYDVEDVMCEKDTPSPPRTPSSPPPLEPICFDDNGNWILEDREAISSPHDKMFRSSNVSSPRWNNNQDMAYGYQDSYSTKRNFNHEYLSGSFVVEDREVGQCDGQNTLVYQKPEPHHLFDNKRLMHTTTQREQSPLISVLNPSQRRVYLQERVVPYRTNTQSCKTREVILLEGGKAFHLGLNHNKYLTNSNVIILTPNNREIL